MHAVTHMLPFTDFKLQETVKGLSSTASKAALVCESSRFPGDKFNSSFVVRGVQSHTSSDSSRALLLSRLRVHTHRAAPGWAPCPEEPGDSATVLLRPQHPTCGRWQGCAVGPGSPCAEETRRSTATALLRVLSWGVPKRPHLVVLAAIPASRARGTVLRAESSREIPSSVNRSFTVTVLRLCIFLERLRFSYPPLFLVYKAGFTPAPQKGRRLWLPAAPLQTHLHFSPCCQSCPEEDSPVDELHEPCKSLRACEATAPPLPEHPAMAQGPSLHQSHSPTKTTEPLALNEQQKLGQDSLGPSTWGLPPPCCLWLLPPHGPQPKVGITTPQPGSPHIPGCPGTTLDLLPPALLQLPVSTPSRSRVAAHSRRHHADTSGAWLITWPSGGCGSGLDTWSTQTSPGCHLPPAASLLHCHQPPVAETLNCAKLQNLLGSAAQCLANPTWSTVFTSTTACCGFCALAAAEPVLAHSSSTVTCGTAGGPHQYAA
ncbi:hypothetical protein Anapl_11903 [Anas platyrhynchos]|uniref:Uncharacterized protein n=1 Tax=Anas platyrhynchos TaxID=8839 RepID=R0KUA7_ANAPL|nr:hypothetical protein Anapl_11903 [Anas platyrhynchos]